MALPLAALALQSGVSLLGSHILRAQAVETAFNMGGRAFAQLLPSQGRDMGLSEFYAPTMSTLGSLASATLSSRDLGHLQGKAELVVELARDALNSPESIAMSEAARRTLGAIDRASSAFSESPNALQLFAAAQSIDLSLLQAAGASPLSSVLGAFSTLLDAVSHFTGQHIDMLAQVGPTTPDMRG